MMRTGIQTAEKHSTAIKDMGRRVPAHWVAGILFLLFICLLAGSARTAEASAEDRLIAGPNRYATAALLAEAYAEENGMPEEVILVTGQDYPDALAANALAGVRHCPIVLSMREALPKETIGLLRDKWGKSVKTVTFIGGGFDETVPSALKETCGVMTVDTTSFAGSNRRNTADKVCQAVLNANRMALDYELPESVCFIATGCNPPDALAAAAWSYTYRIPILLTNKSGEISAETKALANQFDKILILGGDIPVAASVEKAFGTKALRIGGSNRYETSINIAYHFQSIYKADKIKQAVFALGKNKNFPDALAAGPYAGEKRVPVILIDENGFRDRVLALARRFSAVTDAPDSYIFTGAAACDDLASTVRKQLPAGDAGGQDEIYLAGRIAKPTDDAGIAAGVYEIGSAKRPDLNIAVPGGTVSDTVLILEKEADAGRQKFAISPLGNGVYAIVNAVTGRSLDIPSASTESRTALSQHRRNQSAAQRFYIRKGPGGTCLITPANADKPISVKECNAIEKAELQIYHYQGAASQFFILKEAAAEPPGDGLVMIHSAADDSLVLTMASDDPGKGVVLRLEKAASSKAARQRFTVSHLADGCLISPSTSWLALDIKGGTIADGTTVQQHTPNGTAAQTWTLTADGRGGYKIASAADVSLMLTPSARQSGAASDVRIRKELDSSETAWQTFTFETIDPERVLPDGVYNLASYEDPALVFDVESASRALKANVRLHKANATNAQQFSVLYQGGGLYKIKNVNSAMTLDIANGSATDGANVQQYRDNGTEAQRWRFISFNDGRWQIVGKGGKALAYEGGAPSNNANIRLSQKGSASNQLFTLKSVRVRMITDIRDMAAGSLPEEGTFDRGALSRYFQVYGIAQGDAVFNRMSGKSYPAGCPIPLSSLRYIKALHVNFDGKVQVGEMVVNAAIAADAVSIFEELFRNSYQIRQMRLIDDFWTGDAQSTDYASETADNSSCFNYRRGVNQTTGLSIHAYGCAIDINPRENPYVEFNGAGQISYFEPANGADCLDRSKNGPHYITNADLCCRLFKQRGFRWLGDSANPADYMHFERM